MYTDLEIKPYIERFAGTISNQQVGIIPHIPEEWALPNQCFENARQKTLRAGGRIQFGWMFLLRMVERIQSQHYLVAVNHAVWYQTNGQLIDVTPLHPNERHRPLMVNGSTIFLVDDCAEAFTIKNLMAPRPSKFYAIGENKDLCEYIQHLNQKEEIECREQVEILKKFL